MMREGERIALIDMTVDYPLLLNAPINIQITHKEPIELIVRRIVDCALREVKLKDNRGSISAESDISKEFEQLCLSAINSVVCKLFCI